MLHGSWDKEQRPSVHNFVVVNEQASSLWTASTALYDICHHYKWNEKKCSEETQTLRAGCSKAEPKIFAPPQTPFPGARDGQNVPLPTNPVWWGSMHAISSYRGNRPTHTHPPTHRQDRLQYTAPQLVRSVMMHCADQLISGQTHARMDVCCSEWNQHQQTDIVIGNTILNSHLLQFPFTTVFSLWKGTTAL